MVNFPSKRFTVAYTSIFGLTFASLWFEHNMIGRSNLMASSALQSLNILTNSIYQDISAGNDELVAVFYSDVSARMKRAAIYEQQKGENDTIKALTDNMTAIFFSDKAHVEESKALPYKNNETHFEKSYESEMSLAKKEAEAAKNDKLRAAKICYFLQLNSFFCELSSREVDELLHEATEDKAKSVEDFKAASQMKMKAEKNKASFTELDEKLKNDRTSAEKYSELSTKEKKQSSTEYHAAVIDENKAIADAYFSGEEKEKAVLDALNAHIYLEESKSDLESAIGYGHSAYWDISIAISLALLSLSFFVYRLLYYFVLPCLGYASIFICSLLGNISSSASRTSSTNKIIQQTIYFLLHWIILLATLNTFAMSWASLDKHSLLSKSWVILLCSSISWAIQSLFIRELPLHLSRYSSSSSPSNDDANNTTKIQGSNEFQIKSTLTSRIFSFESIVLFSKLILEFLILSILISPKQLMRFHLGFYKYGFWIICFILCFVYVSKFNLHHGTSLGGSYEMAAIPRKILSDKDNLSWLSISSVKHQFLRANSYNKNQRYGSTDESTLKVPRAAEGKSNTSIFGGPPDRVVFDTLLPGITEVVRSNTLGEKGNDYKRKYEAVPSIISDTENNDPSTTATKKALSFAEEKLSSEISTPFTIKSGYDSDEMSRDTSEGISTLREELEFSFDNRVDDGMCKVAHEGSSNLMMEFHNRVWLHMELFIVLYVTKLLISYFSMQSNLSSVLL
eukprot:CAMPEP_0194414524 /NCGR_PEP_ID=MMETSP0176-20130528/13196_1 /TAXON_ID=216777 /ORGANISM="Proboscia alata, Strain PI-D3" /LENGTH=738 /DNA_ID=CAMNT_0039218587 /DNA_START=184 /DNA_END=2397 /DNA_ORIENTATION=+